MHVCAGHNLGAQVELIGCQTVNYVSSYTASFLYKTIVMYSTLFLLMSDHFGICQNKIYFVLTCAWITFQSLFHPLYVVVKPYIWGRQH